MKLVTSAQNLKSGLRLFRGLIQKHMNIPVVRCVQISGDTLSGTDLDNDLSVRIAVKEADGDMLVDYSQLLEIVSLIPSNEDVTLTQSEDRKAVLSFGSAQYNLLAARPGDYHPAITIPTVKPKIFRCGNAGLAAAFKRVSHAISTEETRYWYYLNGACLTKDKDGNPYVAATDGHRLAAKPVPAAKHFDGQIVQRRAIDFVLRFGEPTEVHFWPDSNVARFELPGATLVTKLIDGSFPDWTRVIPDQGDTQMTLNARAAKAALKRLAVGPERAAYAAFFFQDGKVIAARTCDGGDRFETISEASSFVGADGPQAVNLNIKHVSDQLARAEAEDVEFCILSDISPVISKTADAIDVLMPYRGISAEDVRAMLPKATVSRRRAA